MSLFQELLVAQDKAAAAQSNYTTAKSIIDPTALFQFPANYIKIGKCFRITALLGLSNIVTTPGTIVFQVMLGANAVWSSGNIQLNAAAHTLLPLWVEVILTCRATGVTTSANLMGMGRVQGIHPTLTAGQVDDVNSSGVLSAPATAPAVGNGFDSTILNVLDFWAGFSIANAGNSVQVQQYLVEDLNIA